MMFASARCSAILATLIDGISKLSGLRWFQKMDNLECGRNHVSEIKLKRTDTTLDPERLLAIDQTDCCWGKGTLTKPKGKGAADMKKVEG